MNYYNSSTGLHIMCIPSSIDLTITKKLKEVMNDGLQHYMYIQR